MAHFVPVDDPSDPRLIEVSGLTDAAARARADVDHGCFVVEGALALEATLRSPYPVRTVLVSEAQAARVGALIDTAQATTPVLVGSAALLEAVTGFAIHRGIIASAGRLALPDPHQLVTHARRVAILEGINDHENIGALFRNAAAFGIDALLLDPTTSDPLYRRSVRVSLGHVLRVPWTRVADVDAAIEATEAAGMTSVALTSAGATALYDLDPDQPVAWLLGAEGPGLSDAALARATHRVRIPIAPGVDSLNVATAAAVAFAHGAPRH